MKSDGEFMVGTFQAHRMERVKAINQIAANPLPPAFLAAVATTFQLQQQHLPATAITGTGCSNHLRSCLAEPLRRNP